MSKIELKAEGIKPQVADPASIMGCVIAGLALGYQVWKDHKKNKKEKEKSK